MKGLAIRFIVCGVAYLVGTIVYATIDSKAIYYVLYLPTLGATAYTLTHWIAALLQRGQLHASIPTDQ